MPAYGMISNPSPRQVMRATLYKGGGIAPETTEVPPGHHMAVVGDVVWEKWRLEWLPERTEHE